MTKRRTAWADSQTMHRCIQIQNNNLPPKKFDEVSAGPACGGCGTVTLIEKHLHNSCMTALIPAKVLTGSHHRQHQKLLCFWSAASKTGARKMTEENRFEKKRDRQKKESIKLAHLPDSSKTNSSWRNTDSARWSFIQEQNHFN